MKLIKWALVATVAATATPALAANEGDKSNPAVWIALGVVFMGAFTTMIGTLLAAKAKKDKKSDGE